MNEQTKQNEKKTIRPEAWTDQTTNKLIGYYNSAGLGDNSGTFNLKSVIPTLKSLLEKHTQEPACQRLLTSLLRYDCRTGQNSVEELDRLYNEFKSNIEPFARIILNYCSNGITPKPNDSSISLINKSLLEILKTKCRPNDTELNLLTTSFSKGENFRNAQQHNAADPDARHLMSISCNTALEYIFAVTAIYRKIQRARGGVRFTSDCRCDLNFLQDRCSPIPFSKIEADKTIQIEGKPGAFRLQITITIDDGSQRILNREGTIIQGKYLDLTFSLSQEMNIGRKGLNVFNPLIDEEDEEDEIEGIPYHGGIYIGPINDKGQPHGIGILHKQGIKFSGRFNHGQPAGPFIVSGEGFDYKGSVRTEGEMWSLNQGTMTRRIRKKSGEQTWSIEGNFKDLFCVEGKLSVDGQLIYEGPFAIKKGHEVAEGNGMLYLPGGATYRGELVNGKPQGRGIWLNADLTEAHYADWIGGKLLGDETRIIEISGDSPACLCDGVTPLCSFSGHPLRLHLYDIANLMLNAKNQEGRSVDCPATGNIFHYELIDYDRLILKPQRREKREMGVCGRTKKGFYPVSIRQRLCVHGWLGRS